MTQIGRILCALCGGLIGYSITYAWCRFWDFIGRKRVEIPEIKYDVTDNPILQLKNRLGQAYVATYDRTVKKLLHRLLEYVEWIDNWHKEQVLIVESERNDYKRKAERLQAEFEAECSKNAELEKQLKSVGEKYVFCYNMLQKEMLSDWKPIERAENVREALCSPQDEPKINDSEFVEKVRDFWGTLTDKKSATNDELKRHYAGALVCESHSDAPLRRFKVQVLRDKDNLFTEWTLPATSINQIRFMLGEDGIQVVGYEELP